MIEVLDIGVPYVLNLSWLWLTILGPIIVVVLVSIFVGKYMPSSRAKELILGLSITLTLFLGLIFGSLGVTTFAIDQRDEAIVSSLENSGLHDVLLTRNEDNMDFVAADSDGFLVKGLFMELPNGNVGVSLEVTR